jgi:cytochrome c oxidase cbb3-type subunit 4
MIELIRESQAYSYAFGTAFLAMILYWYIYYLYSSEKRGEKDFEKYSNIALDDNIDSEPIEKYTAAEREKMKKDGKGADV